MGREDGRKGREGSDRGHRVASTHTTHLHSIHLRVLPVEVEREAVRDLSIGREAGPKPKRWDHLVTVIRSQNTSH